MPAHTREARQARKPYTKPLCTSHSQSDLFERIRTNRLLLRAQARPFTPVISVENFSGSLPSLVRAVDTHFYPEDSPNPSPVPESQAGRAPAPVIILLNSDSFRRPAAAEDAAFELGLWTVSGSAGARDVAAAISAVCEFELRNRSRSANSVLEGEPHD